MKFEQFNLAAPLLLALGEKGYTTPTPVQERTIPTLLHGNDLLACAQTGTGKTAAFMLPILNQLTLMPDRKGIKALILAPTRELANQISRETDLYSRHTDIRNTVIIGGESMTDQLYLTQRGTDILIATPGRLLHLLDQHLIDLRDLRWLVVDEADRMLDMGFIGTIRNIARKLPHRRQTALFSATLPVEATQLAKELLRKSAEQVDLTSNTIDLSLIQQSAYYVDKQNKFNLMKHLLQDNQIETALVFVRTKYDSEKLAESLQKAGFTAGSLHGSKEQQDRDEVFRAFLTGKVKILVATDLAARGIDIRELPCVFNYELPNEPDTYLHRIGRTGRAGNRGVAISLCSNAELRFLKAIRKHTKCKISLIESHPFSYTPREKGTPRQSAASVGRMKKQ